MKRATLIVALSAIYTALAWTSPHSMSDSPVMASSHVAESGAISTTEVPLYARLARDWGLKPDEWTRYLRLMKGPLGIWSPHLDPLTALGIEARSEAEREHYAALEARLEGERVAKILAYQRAYDAAWKQLYPQLQPVDFTATALTNSRTPDVGTSNRLAVFVKEACPRCDTAVNTLQAEGRSFDIYVVGLEDDAQLRAWAARVGLNPARVRAGAITLNHDEGRWLAIGDRNPLPAVLRQVNAQWQRE